nr:MULTISPECIES: hypothetical protein [unclassified Moorena]
MVEGYVVEGYVVESYVVEGYVVEGYVVEGYVVEGYVVESYVLEGYVVERDGRSPAFSDRVAFWPRLFGYVVVGPLLLLFPSPHFEPKITKGS